MPHEGDVVIEGRDRGGGIMMLHEGNMPLMANFSWGVLMASLQKTYLWSVVEMVLSLGNNLVMMPCERACAN